MPDFPAYSREELDQRARTLIRLRRRNADVSTGSDYDLWARLLGALAWAQQKQAEAALRLLDQTKAFGGYLRQYALENGIGRDLTETSTAATRAIGKVIILGTSGATQPSGSLLVHADGTEYVLDGDVTMATIPTSDSGPVPKVLRSGFRSGRRRLFQGHVGDGFIEALVDEVYLASATGEYCALRDVENATALLSSLFDLYNALDADPAMHDTFVQQAGAVGNITAVEAGQRGNKDPKDTLTLSSPASGILAEAHILTLRGGADEMSPAEMQRAIHALHAERLGAMTLEEIRALATAYPVRALRECFVVPGQQGIGSYNLLPVGAESHFVGPTDLAAVVAHVEARLSPVDKFTASSVYEAYDGLEQLEIKVDDIHAPDWLLTDGSSGIVVDPGSTVDVVQVASQDDFAVGDRVIIAAGTAGGHYLVQRRVVAPFTATSFGVDRPLPFPPPEASLVTPGGPLGDGLIAALYRAYDRRSPSADDALMRHPAPESSGDVQGIYKAISDVPGVLDVRGSYGAPPAFVSSGGVAVPFCAIRMF